MNTKEMSREQISALADGELADEHLEMALATLRREDGRTDWEIYHQIGDVLRSDDMGIEMSPGFAARMAARLEMEPAIVAPATASVPYATPQQLVTEAACTGSPSKRAGRRWAMQGIAAAAAMATVAFITVPQFAGVVQGEGRTPGVAASVSGAAHRDAGVTDVSVVSAKVPEGVILRDPRIDEYLIAHQRLSPSMYSIAAPYARSATFENDSNK